jgi:hypothetical protein
LERRLKYHNELSLSNVRCGRIHFLLSGATPMSIHPLPRTVEAQVVAIHVELDPAHPEIGPCPQCDLSLELHQPDFENPSRLLGICSHCRAWYIIDVDPDGQAALAVFIPEIETLS